MKILIDINSMMLISKEKNKGPLIDYQGCSWSLRKSWSQQVIKTGSFFIVTGVCVMAVVWCLSQPGPGIISHYTSHYSALMLHQIYPPGDHSLLHSAKQTIQHWFYGYIHFMFLPCIKLNEEENMKSCFPASTKRYLKVF